MLAEAFAFYRRHFGALVLTAALALVPANLLMVGALVFGLASLDSAGAAETRTHTQQVQERQSRFRDSPPADPDDGTARLRQLGREALEGRAAFDPGELRLVVPLAYAIFVAMAVLVAGLSFAHAALVPLVLDRRGDHFCGPAQAWAVVSARLRPLAWTVAIGVLLVAFASVFFLVPGLLLAVGFAFAIPVALLEGLSGRAALERSWALSRGRWGQVLGMLALIAGFTVLASACAVALPPGPWRLVASGAVRLIAYPWPLAGLVLIYERARRAEGQYIRRISAPG